MNPVNSIFTEKYRPRKINDIVGDFKVKIKEYLKESSSIPNFLFYSSSPGTGKTTLGKAIINELGCDALILNSSDDRKIETVREKVKEFALTRSSKEGLRRCVFMDEFDGMCLTYGTEIITGTLKNPFIKKIENINKNKYVCVPSVNINTGQLENDKGILVDSGVADFFEIELEDGRKIVASYNHPFFKEGFIETKLKDLQSGDNIIDYSDDIYKKCPMCDKIILYKQITCSMVCKNKLHSKRQTNEGNSHFGKLQTLETRKLISNANKGKKPTIAQRVNQSMFMKDNNPMKNKESRLKISQHHKGRMLSESWKKKISESHDIGIGTEKYEIYCKNKNRIQSLNHKRLKKQKQLFHNCEICDIKQVTKNKNSGMIIHHIDKNHDNNNDKNLVYICSICHNHIHNGKKYRTHEVWLQNYAHSLIQKDIILYGEF